MCQFLSRLGKSIYHRDRLFASKISNLCQTSRLRESTWQTPKRHWTSETMSGLKRPTTDSMKTQRKIKRKKNIHSQPLDKERLEGNAEEILSQDVNFLLEGLSMGDKKEDQASPPDKFSQVELSIRLSSSTGDGLAVSEDGRRVFVVPFTVPGDVVVAKVVRNYEYHSVTDLISVKAPSSKRDDSLVFCQYFGRCSGCQFQMLSYEHQLEHKREVIQKAMKNFSKLEEQLIPPVGEVMPSPLSRGYRTKLTPHFDGPRRGGFKEGHPTPDIGFQVKGRNFVLDIEDCPIGTKAVREGMKQQRQYVKKNLHTFKRGATLLLRESTERIVPPEACTDAAALPQYKELKNCVTDSKSMSTEWIGPYKFISPAGAFFQNNNSILINFTDFVRDHLQIPDEALQPDSSPNSYLIDAYCGSGLFSICCGHTFKAALGVDISPQSIESAKENAEANGIKNAQFITGKAEAIFADVFFPPDRTSIVIDPPRKGCDESFLEQLLELGPKRILYISCNVHTMARDVGWLMSQDKAAYTIDSLGGFDFFPQTHHVEGYAVLSRQNSK